MHTDEHKDGDPIQDNPLVEMGYEPQDIGTPAIRRFTVWFFGFAVVSFAVVFGLMKAMGFDLAAADRAREEALPFQNRIPEAPNPLLQSNVTAKADIAVMRKEENEALNNYGWVNREKGVVRIPIDRAIQLLGQRGIAPVSPNMAAESKGTTAPEVLRSQASQGRADQSTEGVVAD